MSPRRVGRAVDKFFFLPASARPLAALRVGLAAALIVQALCLPAVSYVYVASLMMLAVGLFTRASAVAAWFLHWTLVSTTSTTSDIVDIHAQAFLFYLMWVPAGRAFSLDVALGREESAPTSGARLGLRVLQLHLCLLYLAGGLRAEARSLPEIAIELGYCVFIWPARTRRLWIAFVVALHLSSAASLGHHVSAAIMCVLSVTVFGLSPEPRNERAQGRTTPGRR